MFTASQIAACLGMTPKAIRRTLRDVAPESIRIVQGNESAAWNFAQFPQALKDGLAREARRRGCRDAESLLAAPPVIWQPPLPLDKVADADIETACKLRDVFRPWLVQQHDLTLSSAAMEEQGARDYARIFGHPITCRYWRELFARTLRRDNGAENWDRLEIFLPERPAAKQPPARVVSEALAEDFAELASYIDACRNPSAPSEIERRGIWTVALEKHAAFVRAGTAAKKAERRIRTFLFAKAPFLAKSREALLKAFKRKLATLQKHHGDPASLCDGRESNGARYVLPDADRDLLIHRSVFHYRGDIAPAWRDCLQGAFSETVRARYAGNAASKTHVPGSILNDVSAEVEILTVMHQGPRAFDSIKGHVERSYDGIFSLDCMSADDFTMPVYFYVPDGKGWFNLTRGQILIFIDFRTLRILGWSIQPDRNYSSLTIRSLCTHVFGEHGLPKALQFERGIWKSSILLKGRDPAPFEFSEVVQGLREFGIKFIHSIRPRSKVVERVGGLLQDLMEADPGYCGRDERRDAPEMLRKQMAGVESGKVHPSDHFYSFDQWQTRFGEIVARYNAAAQEGKILAGISPDEALLKFANLADPPMQFTAAVRYLLAHDKRIVPVTLNGITIQIGKNKFNYRSTELARLVGKDALAWFDPQNPESLVVTDKKRKNPICVGRSNPVSALECLVDPDSSNLARELKRVEDQASYMKARFTAVKSIHPMPQRQLLADANTRQLGQEIAAQKKQVSAAKCRHATQRAVNLDKARALEIPAALIDDEDKTRTALQRMADAERDHNRHNEPEAPAILGEPHA